MIEDIDEVIMVGGFNFLYFLLYVLKKFFKLFVMWGVFLVSVDVILICLNSDVNNLLNDFVFFMDFIFV